MSVSLWPSRIATMSATEHHTMARERGWLFLLVASTLGLSWLLVQVVHEFGHVLHAWVSGGTVVRVVLQPLEISRTDVSPNPHPQFVAWGGAVWGCLIPLGGLAVVRLAEGQYRRRLTPRDEVHLAERDVYGPHSIGPGLAAWLATFFAGFCLIANGGYLAIGLLDGIGDAGDLLAHGAPAWLLIAFGAVTIPGGLWLWHQLGPRMGLASPSRLVSRRSVIATLVALIVVVVLEVVYGRATHAAASRITQPLPLPTGGEGRKATTAKGKTS